MKTSARQGSWLKDQAEAGAALQPFGGVPVVISQWVPKDYLRVVGGEVIAGSFDILRMMVDWVNAHRVRTSPECWITDDGELVDAMPAPMRPLP
jgi:hypothetical protein